MEIQGKYTTAFVTIDQVESQCINQLYNMVNNPAFKNHVAIMPDTHAGKGSVVGFTMPLGDKIIPNVVGVDIGCGMLAVKFELNEELDRKSIDAQIKRTIPTGTHMHKECIVKQDDWSDLYDTANKVAVMFINKYNQKFGTNFKAVTFTSTWFDNKIKQIGIDPERAKNSLGTLGGGNHFIEIGKSNVDGKLWLTIHSGSRKFGECICRYHQNIAKTIRGHKYKVLLQEGIDQIHKTTKKNSEISKKIKELRQSLGMDHDVDSKGMEFLEGQQAIDYFMDMIFAQQYALLNRKLMCELILRNINGSEALDTISSIHNYIDFSDLIIRKGAIRLYEGERAIIPFNMEDGLLITEGKSNEQWNYSAPHGAGRLMSRSKAKEVLSLDEMKAGMKHSDVFSSSLNKNTLDEAKGAYKDSKMIEEAITPTAKIIEKVKPIINIKDSSKFDSWKDRRKKKKRNESKDL